MERRCIRKDGDELPITFLSASARTCNINSSPGANVAEAQLTSIAKSLRFPILPARRGHPVDSRLPFWDEHTPEGTCDGCSWCCTAVPLPLESRLQGAHKLGGPSRQRPTPQTTACPRASATSHILTSAQQPGDGLQLCRGRGAGRLAKERHRAQAERTAQGGAHTSHPVLAAPEHLAAARARQPERLVPGARRTLCSAGRIWGLRVALAESLVAACLVQSVPLRRSRTLAARAWSAGASRYGFTGRTACSQTTPCWHALRPRVLAPAQPSFALTLCGDRTASAGPPQRGHGRCGECDIHVLPAGAPRAGAHSCEGAPAARLGYWGACTRPKVLRGLR